MLKKTPITGTTVMEIEETVAEVNCTMRYHIHCAKMLAISAPYKTASITGTGNPNGCIGPFSSHRESPKIGTKATSVCQAVKETSGMCTGQRFIAIVPNAQKIADPISSNAPSGERPITSSSSPIKSPMPATPIASPQTFLVVIGSFISHADNGTVHRGKV